MNKKSINKIIWSSLTIFIFFMIDRVVKYLFLEKLFSFRKFFLDNFIGFAFQKNEGISYGLSIAGWITITATLLILLVIIFFIVRTVRKEEWIFFNPLLLVLLGGVSNFIDRLKFGYVIDMVNFKNWITFNIADIMILIGAIWLVVVYIRNNDLTENKKIDNLR